MGNIQKEKDDYEKRLDVLNKFSEEFALVNYNHDPHFRIVVEMLIGGSDPYRIIEELLRCHKNLLEKMREVLAKSK